MTWLAWAVLWTLLIGATAVSGWYLGAAAVSLWRWYRRRRRPRVLGRGGRSVLVNDVDRLRGDELFEVGDGMYVAMSDFGDDTMPLRDRSGRILGEEGA